MNYLKLISSTNNFEAANANTTTGAFRVVDANGNPVAGVAPVGLILPKSVLDINSLKGGAMFSIQFTEVEPTADV